MSELRFQQVPVVAAERVNSALFRGGDRCPVEGYEFRGDSWAQNERNFVAVPEERMTQFKEIAGEETRS
jgi:hypothetical protein